MKTETILKESEYEKIVQIIDKGRYGTMTYTKRYGKVFSKNYENGFKWVLM